MNPLIDKTSFFAYNQITYLYNKLEDEQMNKTKTGATQSVLQYMKDKIESGEWKTGDKIPSENELAKALEVSRSTVRFAIQQFIAVGSMVSIHGKGTFVKSENLRAFANTPLQPRLVEEGVRKIMEFRSIIEPAECYLSAQNDTDENIENLTLYLEAMLKNIGNDDEITKNDCNFHLEIARASGNQFIESSLADVLRQRTVDMRAMKAIFGYQDRGYQDGIYYHTIILKAIKERKPQSAKKHMAEHIQQSIERDNLG